MARAKQNQEEFIALFRDLPCLWQTTSKDYQDRKKKEIAYQRLLDKMMELEPQASKDCVIKKINNMRSSFRKELKKIKESTRTLSGSDEVYQPKLWYFEHLRFLYDQETPQTSRSNVDEYENEKSIELPSRQRDLDDSLSSTPEPAKKKCRLTPSSSSIVNNPQEIKKEISKSGEEDEFDIFGKHIAMQLRSLSAEQAILGQAEIQKVVTNCRLNDLKYRTINCTQFLKASMSPASTPDSNPDDGID